MKKKELFAFRMRLEVIENTKAQKFSEFLHRLALENSWESRTRASLDEVGVL